MNLRVSLVKAFTKDPSQGNPAGVALDTENVKDADKQKLAIELGFSESSFVEPSKVADYRVRFFTVQQEVDFCGHATVATFFTLMSKGYIKSDEREPTMVTQETPIGVLPVSCFSDGKVMMGQSNPIFGAVIDDRKEVARLLSLPEPGLLDLPVQIVSTGINKLIVPVKDLSVLRTVKPKFEDIVRHGHNHNYSGIALLSPEAFTPKGNFATRSFNPSVGINEDPATGVAAGPLGCYTQKYLFPSQSNFVVEQGFDMGKASTIYVELRGGVRVSGYAVNFGERQFTV